MCRFALTMVDVKQVLESDAPNPLINQLGDALLELNAHNDASEDRVQWEEIKEHFCSLETTLRKNFEELEAKEKKFAEQEDETCASLAEREAAVIVKEHDLFGSSAGAKRCNCCCYFYEARVIHQHCSTHVSVRKKKPLYYLEEKHIMMKKASHNGEKFKEKE